MRWRSKMLLSAVLTKLLLVGPLFAQSPTPTAAPSFPIPSREVSPASQTGSESWFKGNLHTHSLWSDGNDFPEMIVDWYRTHGYQFLSMSDHNVLGQGRRWMSTVVVEKRAKGSHAFDQYLKRFGDDWVETRKISDDSQVRIKPLNEYRTLFEEPGKFLLIQGEEITDRFRDKDIHMNATNLAEPIRPQGGNSVVEAMKNNLTAVDFQRRRTGRPILVHLNHPNFTWSITAEELAMVLRERYFEVYNGHPSTNTRGDGTHASTEKIWDIVNTLRIAEMNTAPVYGLASDDSHNYFSSKVQDPTPGRGWIMVQARYLTPESLIHSIEQGRFYASSGVTLRSVEYSDASNRLEIEIEPRGDAKYTTRFIGTLEDYDPSRKPIMDDSGVPLHVTQEYSADVGKVLATVEGTKASYELTGQELYVRAVVTSSEPPPVPSMPEQQAQAWTQPVGWKKWVVFKPLGPNHFEGFNARERRSRSLSSPVEEPE